MEIGSLPIFCINCGSPSASMILEDENMIRLVQQWVAPRSVQAEDLICTVCWAEASTVLASHIGQTCALCERVLAPRTRSHQVIGLRTDTLHNVNIKNVILERLLPIMPRASYYICHPCWQRADRAAKHYTAPSTSSSVTGSNSNPLKCANCDINITRMRRHILINEIILQRVQQHVAPRVVTANDFLCDACHTIFTNNTTDFENTIQPLVGHQNVCLECGCSVATLQHHIVEAEQNRHIINIVQNWIHPREIQPSDVICDRCFQRAQAAAVRANVQTPQEPQTPQVAERITLPNYSRAPETHARCIFPLCNSTLQQIVPMSMRVRLFSDHKYYIPRSCRICTSHLESQTWSLLYECENAIHGFTATHIEDFCELLKNDKSQLDFENIEQMEDNMVRYWLGRTKQQFRELEAELPNFQKRATALGAYLMKLRTGDSDDRLSTLLKISQSTLNRYINKARELMLEHIVPQQLGLQHISREEVAARNLYIPNSLFGNPGSHMEDRKAIAIMDGTYIYVEKSTNYSYQKKTYSLHKYRNLVKPFMIVCCDGHIIDILGPYPATKSDADILKDEFGDASRPLRQFFRQGDVFILDRGFRDSISLLENLQYSVHYPLSLEPGEHQLPTAKANESRKVTLCRWVVEVVNGRFKRDFKLLRQEYFNKASRHLMTDFKVAAALINRYHPVLSDREDAREIVSIVQEKMFTNNLLADFVESNQLNRRRAQFENICVERDNLERFPEMSFNDLLLIPLGIYQIKQARSYYGEHIRQDGKYIIEVCREVDEELIHQLRIQNTALTLLLRGKIRSRHITHKTYYIYIVVDLTETGRNAIKQYCCNCIVGRRTIGCCAHVMTIIWYLSWARHQPSIEPPAQFLDNILIESIDDSLDV